MRATAYVNESLHIKILIGVTCKNAQDIPIQPNIGRASKSIGLFEFFDTSYQLISTNAMIDI